MLKRDIIYWDLSFEIIGICIDIHNELGRYKNEQQYCDRFEQLLIERKIEHEREKQLPPSFEGEKKFRNRIDFILYNKIVVDFKAKDLISKHDYYQMQRYLTTFDKKLGIIVNFRSKYLKQKRVINPEFDKKRY